MFSPSDLEKNMNSQENVRINGLDVPVTYIIYENSIQIKIQFLERDKKIEPKIFIIRHTKGDTINANRIRTGGFAANNSIAERVKSIREDRQLCPPSAISGKSDRKIFAHRLANGREALICAVINYRRIIGDVLECLHALGDNHSAIIIWTRQWSNAKRGL